MPSTRTLSDAQKAHKKAYAAKRYQENKERIKATTAAWGRKHIHLRKGYVLKTRYGITKAERDALFAAQGFVCAICKSDDPADHRDWHTDHDHETGQVRGVLCARCNHMLGHAQDNPETLRNAIAYLAGASAPQTS